jgi:hypothetical protein
MQVEVVMFLEQEVQVEEETVEVPQAGPDLLVLLTQVEEVEELILAVTEVLEAQVLL